MKSWLSQTVLIGICSLLAAGVVYLAVGEPDRSYPCEQESLEDGHVCLSTVLNEWNNQVLWVDARNLAAYSKSCVEGAILIPETDAEAHLALPDNMQKIGMSGVEGYKLVIYCATDACGASELVAKKIRNTGFHDDVHVLQGGWKAIAAYRGEVLKLTNP